MPGIALLGSTGSIGCQTLDVVRAHPDRFRVVALAAGTRRDRFAAQCAEFPEATAVCADASGTRPTPDALTELATRDDVDIVVTATSGHDAIPATLAALDAGKIVALANKETIVCAGELIMPRARLGENLRPVDSEHSAIWQSLQSGNRADLRRIIVTASGGPFRTRSLAELQAVTPAQALKHPNWEMGGKITIDSATLMNKGLEVIEAHWLYDMPYEQIDVVVQPESIIHSLVEFADHSVIAQLGWPDMRLPIQYALTWPDHAPMATDPLDLVRVGALAFEAPDETRFPCLRLAREAGQRGGTYPTVLSAADEVLVPAFVAGKIGFMDIPAMVEAVLGQHDAVPVSELDVVLEADRWAHEATSAMVAARAGQR